MSHTLSRLFHQMEHHISPIECFYMYQGIDWKQFVTYQFGHYPYQTVLWKSNDKEIILNSWLKGQSETLVHSTQVTHIRVLQGSLSSVIKTPHYSLSTNILPRHRYTVPFFSTCTIYAPTQSISLSLIERAFHHF